MHTLCLTRSCSPKQRRQVRQSQSHSFVKDTKTHHKGHSVQTIYKSPEKHRPFVFIHTPAQDYTIHPLLALTPYIGIKPTLRKAWIKIIINSTIKTPISKQTPEVSSSRTSGPPRPKRAIHRGNSLMVSLQSELASLLESLASDDSLYELLDSRGIYATGTSNSISTSASTSPPDTPFTNISANTSATSILTTTTLTFSIPRSTHHLPFVITGCIHAGMPACEIGQYLHRITRATGSDCSTTSSTSATPVSSAGPRYGIQAQTGTGNGLVSRMITLNKPYASIATRVMRVLDLHSSDGYPLYAYVNPGDVGLVPRPGEPTRNDDSESDEDGTEDRRGLRLDSPGPKRVWHWGPGQGLLRWPLLDMSDEEIEGLVEIQDESVESAGNVKQDGERTGKKVYLPRLGCASHHTVTIVYPA